jgi:hypothetical protein
MRKVTTIRLDNRYRMMRLLLLIVLEFSKQLDASDRFLGRRGTASASAVKQHGYQL